METRRTLGSKRSKFRGTHFEEDPNPNTNFSKSNEYEILVHLLGEGNDHANLPYATYPNTPFLIDRQRRFVAYR